MTTQTASTSACLATTREDIVTDFVTRGLVVLSPDSLGIPYETHDEIFDQEFRAFKNKQRITSQSLPDILKVLQAPGLRDACERLVGKNYAIVPFTHNTPFMSGAGDQHWHKDDNGPYNMRKQRHHQAVQVEMLYFPQEVKADMGPTATVPYSQYWTFNHEENHDNFAGADHLDFSYQINGMEQMPISGPRSNYALADILNQTTEHDERMRNAVLDLHWPLCQTFEVGPLQAGSVVLYSHNLLHRRNHRRDDWKTWKDTPRFMWRFWLYRTTEPDAERNEFVFPELDEMTDQMLDSVDEDVASVWRYHANWFQCSGTALASPVSSQSGEISAAELGSRIRLKDDVNEPQRIGAGYRLACHPNRLEALSALRDALHSDRENVRRAGLYGLIAFGEDATKTLLDATKSEARWVRKAATFGLGMTGEGNDEVIAALGTRLLDDPSTYVRSVAADGIGCLGRRIFARDANAHRLIRVCAAYLLQSLEREVNRLSMDRAQNRSIKLVRPNDECDVCEGIGFDYGQERFKPVRSVVRENALWSLVILCSHGADHFAEELPNVIASLKNIIAEDENVFSVGLAMDCLQRLLTFSEVDAHPELRELRESLDEIFALTPIHSTDALVASGMELKKAMVKYAA